MWPGGLKVEGGTSQLWPHPTCHEGITLSLDMSLNRQCHLSQLSQMMRYGKTPQNFSHKFIFHCIHPTLKWYQHVITSMYGLLSLANTDKSNTGTNTQRREGSAVVALKHYSNVIASLIFICSFRIVLSSKGTNIVSIDAKASRLKIMEKSDDLTFIVNFFLLQ